MKKFCSLLLSVSFSSILLFSQSSKSSLKTENSIEKKALATIVKHLKNSDSDIKAYAIEALGKTGNEKLIPVLRKYLNDKNKYIIISTVKALWELGDINSIEYLYKIIADVPPAKLSVSTNDPLTQLKIISQNKIREKAIETVVDLIGIKAKDLLLGLKNNEYYGTIRDVAARELAKIGFKNEIDNFYNALKSDDEEIRNQAAENLAKICPEDGYNIAKAFEIEKSVRVKILLLDALKCSIISGEIEKILLKHINDENLTIRHKTIEILTHSGNDKTLEKLKKIYEDTPDVTLKLIIAKRLLEKNMITLTKEDIDYFASVDNSEVKRKIINIIDYVDKNTMKQYLEKYLDDSEPYVQIDAAIKIILTSERKNVQV